MRTENKERKSNKLRKLVCSGILPLCAAIAVIFAVFRTEASEAKEIDYTTEMTYKAKMETPQKDGYLFGGWCIKDGNKYTPISNPKEGDRYFVKFVPAEVLDIRAQVTNDLIEKGEADSVAIRFVTSIDSTDYQKIGFNINKGKGGSNVDTTNTVYEKLYAVEATKDTPGAPMADQETKKEYTAADLFHKESSYFKTWTIRKIPVSAYDADITVTPYWVTLDGRTVAGKTSIKTVNLGRSWVYLNASVKTEDGMECGTKDHPFTNLEDALNAVAVKNNKVVVEDAVLVPETFQWKMQETTKKVGKIAIAGVGTTTSQLDFSNVANLEINEDVTFTNMNVTLPSSISVTATAGGSVAVGQKLVEQETTEQETTVQMQLKMIPDDAEKQGVVIGSEYAGTGKAYFKGVAANCTLLENSEINVNFVPEEAEIETAFDECEVCIDDLRYSTLETAVDIAKRRSDYPMVTLVKDCNTESTLKLETDERLRLCLNDFALKTKAAQALWLAKSTAELYIYDGKLGTGTIEGENTNVQGLVRIQLGRMELHGGTLKNSPTESGSNGMVVKVGNGNNNQGTFYMYGGTITGGNIKESAAGKNNGYGGGVFVSGKDSQFHMFGGVITDCCASDNGGGVYVANDGIFTLSGKAQITGNTVNGAENNVYLNSTASGKANFTVEKLLEEAYVGITTAAENGAEIGTATGAVPEGCLFSDVHERMVLSTGNSLTIDAHCFCGGKDGTHTCDENVEWTPWNGENSGYHYLTEDKVVSTTVSSVNLHLCLNGHKLTVAQNEKNVFKVATATRTLSICDCRKNGTIEGTNQNGDIGGLVYVNQGTMTLYSGTLKQNLEEVGAGEKGTVVRVGNSSNATGTFNMYGGTITGGNVTGNGGGVAVAGAGSIFNMYGGTITGCSAGKQGGGVHVMNSRTFNMHGGTITTCIAEEDGGGVYVAGGGAFSMFGGTIQNCDVATGNGGGVYVVKGGKFTLSGISRVTDNTRKKADNNIYLSDGADITVKGLKPGAMAGISSSNTNIGTADEDITGKLKSDNTTKKLIYNSETKQLTLISNNENNTEE